MKSPLLASADFLEVATWPVDPEAPAKGSGLELIEILKNREVLAVSDDPLGKEAVRLEDAPGTSSDPDVFAGEMGGGVFAIVLFNRGNAAANMTLEVADLASLSSRSSVVRGGNSSSSSSSSSSSIGLFTVRDLWKHTDNGTVASSGRVTATVGPQDVVMLRLTPASSYGPMEVMGLASAVGVVAVPTIVPTITLAGVKGGVEMPLLGLGTGPPYTSGDTYTAALNAFRGGYRAVDTAHNYKNQPSIAAAIRDSGVERSSIFITSKVPGSMSFDDTLRTNDETLRELNTSYVDLMLVHFPVPSQPYNATGGSKTLRQEQWRAMEAWARQGKARAIGVSHHCQRHMEDILEVATLPLAANQVEYHVGMYQGADSQVWMAANNITLLGYLPLCGQCDGADDSALINGTLVSGIAAKHGKKSGAQVSIRWLVQSGVPAIPRSKNPAHTAEDLDVFDFELDAADMQALNAATSPAAADGPKADCIYP